MSHTALSHTHTIFHTPSEKVDLWGYPVLYFKGLPRILATIVGRLAMAWAQNSL